MLKPVNQIDFVMQVISAPSNELYVGIRCKQEMNGKVQKLRVVVIAIL